MKFETIISFGGHNRENPNFQKENELLEKWKEILENRYSCKFIIESNSSDYTTLKPEGCLDLIRLKYGNVKWVKILITNEFSKKIMNDPRFETEKKKSSAYWKSILINDDISNYYDVLDEAFSWLIEHKI